MLNTYIYQLLPPTCFGVCCIIFRETLRYLLKNSMLFAIFEMFLYIHCLSFINYIDHNILSKILLLRLVNV
jgi:hypothetical protein